MTINNADLYMRGVWDWAILDGCFGETRIKPTDIDGCVERNGHALILETKQPGANIPTGQKIMFSNMAKTGFASVIVIWGDTNSPQEMMLFHGETIEDRRPVTLDGLRERVSKWFEWANRQN